MSFKWLLRLFWTYVVNHIIMIIALMQFSYANNWKRGIISRCVWFSDSRWFKTGFRFAFCRIHSKGRSQQSSPWKPKTTISGTLLKTELVNKMKLKPMKTSPNENNDNCQKRQYPECSTWNNRNHSNTDILQIRFIT